MKSNTLFTKAIFAFVVLMFATTISQAQFNVKVGYRLAILDTDGVNASIRAYNDQTNIGQDSRAGIRFLNGLDLGIRYKLRGLAFEAGVFAVNSTQDLYGTLDFDESLQASLRNFYAGVDFKYRGIGIGTHIGSQRLRYQAALGGLNDRFEIYKETQIAHQIHLIFEHASENIAFSLRPYVSYALSPYNLNEVDKALFTSGTTPASEFENDLLIFGLTLTFYNGAQ